VETALDQYGASGWLVGSALSALVSLISLALGATYSVYMLQRLYPTGVEP